MNIDEMPAGREMDALIAEKVMGWRYKEGPKFDYNGPCDWNMILIPPTMSDEEYMHWSFPPKGVISKTFFLDKKYSTDIAAAWEVFTHWGWQGMVGFSGTDWFCEIQTEITGYYHFEARQADTAPLAICRAALKAVGG